MSLGNTVFVLMYVRHDGDRAIASIHTDKAVQENKAERYNADKDPEFPETYWVEEWVVQS